MKALVIGYGSIGARHARILNELGCNTAVLSNRKIDFPIHFSSLSEAIAIHQPEYVIVASDTASHYSDITKLINNGFIGRVLVEKPLFKNFYGLPPNKFKSFNVAYNLRFHPIIQKVQSLIHGQSVISFNAYVGQYLPNWRPETDYTKSYSASSLRGGGVLRDLSHELDFISWLVGEWSEVTALGGHFSDLKIDSEDVYGILWKAQNCPLVCVQLSYLDQNPTRKFIINTNEKTIEADFNLGIVKEGDQKFFFQVDRDHTYREMHIAALNGQYELLCSAEEASEIVALIEAVECANKQKTWIAR